MKEVENIFQAIIILIIGIILFGSLGMASFATQMGSLAILIILVSVAVIIIKLIMDFLNKTNIF